MPRKANPNLCLLDGKDYTADLNNHLKARWTANQIVEWLQTRHGVKVHRMTIYKHRDHAMTPVDAATKVMTQAAAEKIKALQIRETSNDAFLGAIRDIAHAKAAANPEAVTIEQGLKATAILEGRKQKGGETMRLMIGIVTGHRPEVRVEGSIEPEVVEGQAVEIPA